MINNVVLVGRLTKSPELKMTQSNIPFVNFTLAVNRAFKTESGEQEADFISCIVWRKQSESLAKYQTKGSLLGIEGRLQTRTYDKDGTTVYITEVVADSIQFLEPKKSDHPQTDEQIDNTYKHEKTYNVPKKSSEEQFESNVDASSEDLPF